MDSTITFQTPYEKRVELVVQALMASSTLDNDVAQIAAVQVLHALDSVPEKIR
ncbi:MULTISPECIES: DUF6307 family protein [Mycobacteroides]|jgi:hypothetical protein|uniref:Uncharacterized protein n=2 Tax=Mycobacteroides abscessus TaxID=36809 RepID=A0AB74FBJ4_9MYCO|nr:MULTISPECIES: DUF6307 family protein [Mycobacteroides]QSM02168.1 hypothetical protein PROPHIGD20-1_121 [Mycobacterium phage prophiGD20-1]EHM17956.1 hypothetical protein MMAS_24150 [Mycobacteroides abscessus subsp. massiliense CCUG 48898 = JCM 15300]EIT94104.1 hypothetical protein MA4S0726RA_2287 [Mycobacteroides abscessus 4S-0726-RA]EIT96815.1 hypothetical protein MA4S0303_2351 [Mycobacteroides abscessus 4S-0303]EIT98100.1 hypothetical protein MA4S0726RB_1876 [Mycobacteroides abscessus 4S-0